MNSIQKTMTVVLLVTLCLVTVGCVTWLDKTAYRSQLHQHKMNVADGTSLTDFFDNVSRVTGVRFLPETELRDIASDLDLRLPAINGLNADQLILFIQDICLEFVGFEYLPESANEVFVVLSGAG